MVSEYLSQGLMGWSVGLRVGVAIHCYYSCNFLFSPLDFQPVLENRLLFGLVHRTIMFEGRSVRYFWL